MILGHVVWLGQVKASSQEKIESKGCSITRLTGQRAEHQKVRSTYILFGLLDTGINLGYIPLNFIFDALELVFRNDSEACFGVEFSLPNGC